MLFLTKFEKEKLIFKRILPALNCNRFQCGENAVQIAKKQVKNVKESTTETICGTTSWRRVYRYSTPVHRFCYREFQKGLI